MSKGGIVTSNTGFSKGRKAWKVKCVRDSNLTSHTSHIGIVTKSKCIKGDKKDGYINLGHAGNAYFFETDRGRLTKYENGKRQVVVDSLPTWEESDVVTLLLDSHAHKIGFWLNEKKLGILEVPPNVTYYPVLHSYAKSIRDYKLIVAGF